MVGGLLLALGCALCAAAALGGTRSGRADGSRLLAARVDALLPQFQCAKCGYPGCRPYAEAIAAGEADINRCPPGGAATILALAELLGREPMPLDARFGAETTPLSAVIDERICIGCAKCLPACPVDAIVGARRRMHTVLSEHCTGCGLCLPPCPVDCIELRPSALLAPLSEWVADAARRQC